MIKKVNVSEAATALLTGQVLVLPTDTVYGLAAHPEHPEAIANIFILKRRPAHIPLQILIAQTPDMADFTDSKLGGVITPEARTLFASSFMPGPLTLILSIDQTRCPAWLKGRSEVGLRCPKGRIIQSILKDTGPVFATSANLHRHPTSVNFTDVCTSLASSTVTFSALDGGSLSPLPSTVVNLTGDHPKIDRIGAIDEKQIMTCLKSNH